MIARDAQIKQLAKVPLFSECSNRDLGRIAKLTHPVMFEPGATIMTEGTPGGDFYIIAVGGATVRRKGRKIATLGPGDFAGELALVVGGTRTATIVADKPTEVLMIAQRDFRTAISEIPGMAVKMLKAVAGRVAELDRQSL